MGGVVRNIIKRPIKTVAQVVGAPVETIRDALVDSSKAAPPATPPAAASAPKMPSMTATAAPSATQAKPKAVTAAGSAGSTPSATYNMRRRRGRGIATGARGLTTSAPVQRKTLLGG